MDENKKADFTRIVTAAYRAFLRREPDPEGLNTYVSELEGGRNFQWLLEQFIRSEETARVNSLWSKPRQFPLDAAPAMDVQTEYTIEDRRAMWAHVASVWSSYGKRDPYWSVLVDERWRSSKMTNDQVLTAFYKTGENEMPRFDAWLRRNAMESNKDAVCAEYGCGVGRVTRALAKRFAKVIAFDISQPHLDAAQARLSAEGIENVEYVLVKDASDLKRLNGIDLFYSIIVLQHNPPPIIVDILDHAFAGLNPKGAAFFQVPTYSLGYSFSSKLYWERVAAKKSMEMHFLSQKTVFDIGLRHAVVPAEVQSDWCVGNYDRWISDTFLMTKR